MSRIVSVFIICIVLMQVSVVSATTIFSDNFDSGSPTGFAIWPLCPGDNPVVSGGYGSSYTWSTKTYWEHQGSGYYDTCFGDRGIDTISQGSEVYIHYYLKFSNNWTFTETSGLKSFLIGYNSGGGWSTTLDVMITKWAPVSGKVKPYFDVYEDPDAISQGGIPNRENALATGATQAWMDFGWEIDRWYEIKIYCKLNTGSNENGILRYYVDSVLLIEDTSVKIGTNGFNRIMITNYVSGSSGWDPNGTQIYTDELTLSSTDDWSGGDTTPPSATGCTINGATFK